MLVRGVHVAALLSLFGTLIFVAVMAEGLRDAARLRGILHRLIRVSAACALLAGVAWLAMESAVIAGADNVSTTMQALPVVALRTQYGQWFVLRCVLLIVLLVMPLSRRVGFVAAILLAGIALAVQPLLGHAGAMGGNVGRELIASEIVHLAAAGAWLGGLLPLFIAVSFLPHEDAARMCCNFTPIGLSAVLLLAGTAVVQVATLMGGLPGLFGTAYGHVALVKLGLFVLLLTLAAINRLVLTERMAQGGSRSHMRVSIAGEMALGALVVIVAAFLSSLTPGTHEEPVWPFPWRPSLSAFDEPLLRRELVGALAALGVAVLVATVGVVWRRVRWLALAAALVILFLAIPHFDLLLVQAYPTRFFISPTEFAATAIAHGARLFATNCTTCHGVDARGNGPVAKSLPVPPADLTAEHLWGHSDGDLYWFISHGFPAPDGSFSMPAFGSALSSEAIWDLIDYLHARNAGESLSRAGKWLHPLQVLQFDAECADGGPSISTTCEGACCTSSLSRVVKSRSRCCSSVPMWSRSSPRDSHSPGRLLPCASRASRKSGQPSRQFSV